MSVYPEKCQPEPSSSNKQNDEKGVTNSSSYKKIFLPFIDPMLLLAALVCYPKADPDNRDLVDFMLEQSWRTGVETLVRVYKSKLEQEYSKNPCCGFDEKELSAFIIGEIGSEAQSNAVESFHSTVAAHRTEGDLPEDLDAHTDEILRYFSDGIRMRRITLPNGERGEQKTLPTALGLKLLSEWICEYKGVAAALNAASLEILLCIGSKICGIIVRFHEMKLGKDIFRPVVEDALASAQSVFMPDRDRLGVIKESRRVILSNIVYGDDLSMNDIITVYLEGEAEAIRGMLALACAFYSRDKRMQKNKGKLPETEKPLLDMLTDRMCAKGFVNEILKHNPTVRQLLEYLDREIESIYSVGLPVGTYRTLCRRLESAGILDGYVLDGMKGYRTKEYIAGLESFVRSMSSKRKDKLWTHLSRKEERRGTCH
ncbi:MAG: hypothetical protein E7546_05680 [Ruminococcaceae bacterium]|nr:hypothetical protein [Oscillospiraceae bacterium]